MEIILALVGGIVIGYIAHVIVIHRYIASVMQLDDDVPDPRTVTIEKHQDVYLAYSNSNQFLGQNVVLQDLLLSVMENDDSIRLSVSDPDVRLEVKKLISQANPDTADETKQEHQGKHQD